MSKLPYINLGCGFHNHKDWTNVDFISTGEGVIAHNLLAGIPFDSNTFEVAYHSHVLEHFLKPDAERFIAECFRVLKNNGILRIAIPDLEQIARNYIKYLEESINQVPGASEKYNWTVLEMLDQTVRTVGGGGMAEYIKDESKNNDAFLLERNGKETSDLIKNLRNKNQHSSYSKPSYTLKERIKSKLTRMLLGKDMEALRLGKFRLGGEIHQWMYDRYSLSQLLTKHGFKDVRVVKADESSIPNWNSFGLDMVDGKVRKPDSLFIEATKG
jgi:predicted SAM-dependent methyltransferase